MCITQTDIPGVILNSVSSILVSTRVCARTFWPVIFRIAPQHSFICTGCHLFSCSFTERHFGSICGKGNMLTGYMTALVGRISEWWRPIVWSPSGICTVELSVMLQVSPSLSGIMYVCPVWSGAAPPEHSRCGECIFKWECGTWSFCAGQCRRSFMPLCKLGVTFGGQGIPKPREIGLCVFVSVPPCTSTAWKIVGVRSVFTGLKSRRRCWKLYFRL